MRTTLAFWSTAPEFDHKGWLLKMAFCHVMEAIADNRFGFTIDIESQEQLQVITESVPEGWEMSVTGHEEEQVPAKPVHRYRGSVVAS